MNKPMVCWKCGQTLLDLILPMSRREECAACGADQHVCKMCLFYNANIAHQCSEERAEEVTNKESANFCDYFQPRADAWRKKDGRQAASARAKLAALFGEELSGNAEDPVTEDGQSEADKARQGLDDLFGGNKKD